MAKLIVIDGLDGSGKATQAEILYKWLLDNDYNAHKISFPAYESQSSAAIKMYLNKEIGDDPIKLNPYMCSTFYAVDRAIQYTKEYKKIFDMKDAIIVADRYISANIIHQGGKIKGIKNRREFYKWAYEFETGLIGVPKDDMTLVLEVPVWKSQQLMTERYNGDESKKDLHEGNVKYLNMCYDSAIVATDILSKEGYNWQLVNCVDSNGELKTREEISKDILKRVKILLNI